jgi:hypothetical protein
MLNRETYRKKALECLRAADKVRIPGERAALLTVANNYMALVEYLGRRHDHGTAQGSDKDQDT